MTNNPFAETMALKGAFDNSVVIFDQIMAGYSVDLNVIVQTSEQMNICNVNFCRALYDVLEPVTDWNKQNEIYELIKRLIDNDRMFNQEFTGDAYDKVVRNAPSGVAGFQLIQFLPALREACSWFGDGKYRLSGFRLHYQRCNLNAPLRQPICNASTSTQPNATNQAVKAKISTKLLASFMVGNADLLMTKIETILPGCKGKKVATIIRALQELGYITLASGEYKQLYRAIRAHYNTDIGADSGITKYLSGSNPIPEIELMNVKKQLQ